MNDYSHRRLAAMWVTGALLVGAAVFWTLFMVLPAFGPQRMAQVLPKVSLDRQGRAFVRALPELGDEDAQTKPDGPYIAIPSLGVRETIVESPLVQEGWYLDGLESRIAHLEGTDVPGGDGNAAFAGHISLVDNSPGPLANVERLSPGDEIVVVYGATTYRYEVVAQQQVGEDRLEVLYPTDSPTLTLITCSSWSWLNGRYTSRQIVTARPISSGES